MWGEGSQKFLSHRNSKMTNRCVKCWNNFESDYRINVCNGCSSVIPGFPSIYESRWLHKGTAWARKMSKGEENEIGRSVAIPKGDGKFAQGRRMENGKIAEKPIKN